jgi:hypothetical protein
MNTERVVQQDMCRESVTINAQLPGKILRLRKIANAFTEWRRSLSLTRNDKNRTADRLTSRGFEKQVFMRTGTIRELYRLIFFNHLQERNKDGLGELLLAFLVSY